MDRITSNRHVYLPKNQLLTPSSSNIKFNPNVNQSSADINILQPSFPRRTANQTFQKQLSVKSFKSNNKSTYSKNSHLSLMQFQKPQELSQDYLNSTEQTHDNFQTLQRILKEENNNLNKQNKMLLAEIYKLKNSNKKYKDACVNQRIELQAVMQQCEAQKTRANEMKQIIMNRLMSLEAKVQHGKSNQSIQQCQSLLQALNLSEINANQ